MFDFMVEMFRFVCSDAFPYVAVSPSSTEMIVVLFYDQTWYDSYVAVPESPENGYQGGTWLIFFPMVVVIYDICCWYSSPSADKMQKNKIIILYWSSLESRGCKTTDAKQINNTKNATCSHVKWESGIRLACEMILQQNTGETNSPNFWQDTPKVLDTPPSTKQGQRRRVSSPQRRLKLYHSRFWMYF